MGPERRGRAVHGRLEVNPSGEEPTDRPRQKNAGLWEPYDGRLSRTVLREREVSLSCCQVFLGGLGQGLGLGFLVGGLGFEHGEDDVAAASGDADHGGVVAFAL